MSESTNTDITEYDFDKLPENEQCEIISNYLLTKKEGEKLIPQVFFAFFKQIAYEMLNAKNDEQNLIHDDHKINITPANTNQIKALDNSLNDLSDKDALQIITDANIEADDSFKNYQNAKAATPIQQLTQEHEKQQRDIETYNIFTRNNDNKLEQILNSTNEDKTLRPLDTEKRAAHFLKTFPLTILDTEILDKKNLDRSQYIDVFDAKNDDWLMRRTHKIIAKALQNQKIVDNIINQFPTEETDETKKRVRAYILARFATKEKEFLEKQNFNKIDIDAKIISTSEEQTEETKKEKDPPSTKNKTLEILEKKQEKIKNSNFLSDEDKENLSNAINDLQDQLKQDEKNETSTKEHRKVLEMIDNRIKTLKKEFLERAKKEKQDKYIATRTERYATETQRADTIAKNNEEKKRCENENIAITGLKPVPSAKKPIPFFFDGGQTTLLIAGIASLSAAITLAILTNILFATIAVASLAFVATAKVRQTKEQQKVDIENATNYAKANMAQYHCDKPADRPPDPPPTPLPTPYSAKIVKYAKTQKPRKELNNKIQTNLDKINKSKTASIAT